MTSSLSPRKDVSSVNASVMSAPAPQFSNLDAQIRRFKAWAAMTLQQDNYQCLQGISLPPVFTLSPQRQVENTQTLTLFKERFDDFLWTGIECSNPESPQGERWDQLQLAGIYDPARRRRQIELVGEAGLRNIRLGMPNHRLTTAKSWQGFSTILNDFKQAGLKISLDLQHFGLPSRFRDNQNPDQSVYLNPRWPDYYVRLATNTVKRYMGQLDAITLINEPMITNKFSSLLWNEGFPGDYAHPLYYHFFIQRALYMAKAAITARHHIEWLMQDRQQQMVYIHNESCEFQHHDAEFNRYGRFISSDLILGHDWLLQDHFEHTDVGQWLFSHYDRPGIKNDHRYLLNELHTLRDMHRRFQDTFGKTMRADTVFGVDYYLACESVHHGFEYELPVRVGDYRHDVEHHRRHGLARMMVDYWNRYQLPMLHTETNFADRDADEWGMLQLLELALVASTDIPVLGFTWYSLMDQYNWDNALKGSPTQTRIYPVGLFSLSDYQKRPFAERVLPALLQALKG